MHCLKPPPSTWHSNCAPIVVDEKASVVPSPVALPSGAESMCTAGATVFWAVVRSPSASTTEAVPCVPAPIVAVPLKFIDHEPSGVVDLQPRTLPPLLSQTWTAPAFEHPHA